MKLLLHSCCAPCSIQCVKVIRAEGIEPQLFWYNPNIHPHSEYSARRDCFFQFAANEMLKIAEETTENTEGRKIKKILHENAVGTDGFNRCEKCYRMRLTKTASFAAEKGFSAFSTTLLISPYQDHEVIRRIGEEEGVKHGVEFFYRDFRPLFREGQSAARAAGFYMQKYCGCVFSEEERYMKKKEEDQPRRNTEEEFLRKTSHGSTEVV